MASFAISGHKGLVGSVLLEKLIEQGHTPVLLVDLREGQDIRNIHECLVDKPIDIFYHLASFCKINESIKNPSLAYAHNVAGTYAVLEYIRKNKIPKIVFTSSTRVLYPNKNPYVASKIYAEELIKGYSECYGIDYVITRLSTVYHGFHDQTHRLIDIWMRAALKNKALKIYGDTNKTLDFSYTHDVVDGILLASKQTNKEYDIASGESYYLEDVAKQIIKLAGGGYIEYHEPEIAQPQEVSIDIQPMLSLGYRPKIFVERGIRNTFDFYKKLENL